MSGGTLMDYSTAAPHQNEAQAIKHLTKFVGQPSSGDDADLKKKEESIMELGGILAKNKQTDELRAMIQQTRPFLAALGKAKAAKLVRHLVDLCLRIESEDGEIKVALCQECIEWANTEKRTFLRQTLQARLLRLYNDLKRFRAAVELAAELVRELKKVDDKDLIVEVELEESRAYHQLGNVGRARTSLVSARTTANSIYVSPRMQAALDLQSGIIHAADTADFKTAFSYFYEAFEGYDGAGEKTLALQALKYMLLCKVMLDRAEEVPTLLAGKLPLKYRGSIDLDAMRAVAAAAAARSLKQFNETFGAYPVELQQDAVVKQHFNELQERMLEKDLSRLVEPYSLVEIEHIATCIGIPRHKVERKLAQMILDKKLTATLDQGRGVLSVHTEVATDPTYQTVLSTIGAVDTVLDALYKRAAAIR